MLITLEGIDGGGKTTVAEALGSELSADRTVFTREPTDSWYGEAVERSIADDDADPLAELFLYTADHADHLARVIRPALEAGKTVVSDRYSDSRVRLPGRDARRTDRGTDGVVKNVHEPFTRPPDATLYLDLPAEAGAERAGATNKFETAAYLREVRANYERLIEADPKRFHRIDATQSRAEVVAEARAVVSDLVE